MDHHCEHTIVVVAKCPIPGKCKTRLIPLLGEEGSAKLATAMLSDVVSALSECPGLSAIRKILFYAPANQEGSEMMRTLLSELDLTQDWSLMPMTPSDLSATNLGDVLTDILKRTRKLGSEKVIFLGMDSPELPLEEIKASLTHAHEALLCPAHDGGYGMLAVPIQAPIEGVFAGIRWSNSLTALGQLKALTDANIPVRLGRIMNDIDEPEDVKALCQRLSKKGGPEVTQGIEDVLMKPCPSSGAPETWQCRHTRQTLKELNLLS